MLSGIRKGKKKSQKKSPKEPPSCSSAPTNTANVDDNLSVAEKLRQSFRSGDTSILEQRTSSRSIERLERRGLFQTGKHEKDDSSVVVMHASASSKREEEMTATELALREQNATMSWDDQMLRTAVRVGKKRRRDISNNDSDEELEKMKRLLPSHSEKKPEEAALKAMQRERHRRIDQHLYQMKVTSKCAWWIDSNSFSKHRLLALGNHISLVMAPPNNSLVAGHHFYLVPLKHASSFVECDDDAVWDEVRRFQTALNRMYAIKNRGVLMCETVLPNKNFWQTKMEVIALPFPALLDSPLFFKSSMMEQSQEWGTHNKMMATTTVKPLKSVVPKGFPYFFVDWGDVSTSTNTGSVQIIEASDFRHDFGLDTLSSMMDLDPIRFQRKKKFSHEEERQNIAEFLEVWKKFDWTTQLS
jgi:DNA-binding MarR family transcriptional regulator